MLTVIIPTLNANAVLPGLLEQVRGHVDEIVVSDGGSNDTSLKQALGFGARIAVGCPGRGWQLARGARWAQGDWLLFLHADVTLGDGWQEAVGAHIKDHADKAGYFQFRVGTQGWRPRLMEVLVRARCRFLQLPYGDQGLLVSRTLYDEIGGFADWALFEDVAIVRALRKKLRPLAAKIYTNPQQYEKQGYAKRALRNITLFVKYKLGANPDVLAKEYYR